MKKFNKWLKGFFHKPDVSSAIFAEEFTEDQKTYIIDSALTVSGQILMSAVVLTGADNFISGDCNWPDGTVWTLKFERKQEVAK